MEKQVALLGGQTGCLYWGTNRLPLLGDKQVALIGGQQVATIWILITHNHMLLVFGTLFQPPHRGHLTLDI